jgi:hypothetical protein
LAAADEAELLKAGGIATVSLLTATAATLTAITGADGWYDLALTAVHTDTVGDLTVVIQDADVCLPVWMTFQVLSANAYNSMFKSAAEGPLQATTVGNTLDVSSDGGAGIDWSNVENKGSTVDLSATSINLVDTCTTNTDMRGTDSASTHSAGDAAGAVWNRDATVHQTLGTFGQAIGDPTNADTIWDRVASMNGVVGLIATNIGTPVNTDIATDIANVVTTGDSNWATATGFAVQGDKMDLVANAVDGTSLQDNVITNAKLATSAITEIQSGLSTHAAADVVALLNNLAASDVLAQVNAALDTAITELGVAQPSATPSLRNAVMLLYMALRNKSQTTTAGSPDLFRVHDSNDQLIAKKVLTDDSADFEAAQMVAGDA